MALVDVVVVSYNSRKQLRRAVEDLAATPDINVFVVDNASTDGSLDAVADLAVTSLAMPRNGGFAYGCNAGWHSGSAPFVLFLNPDARLEVEALRLLVETAREDERVGAVAPRINHSDGSLDYSQRRFPRLASTYGQALFLHRLFPQSRWSSEVLRDGRLYARPGTAEWVSGACLLVPRSVLERIDGFDEGFFMYCEDKDLCRRIWSAGFEVRFEPSAVCVHEGGKSAPRPGLLPVLASSRIRYARKHRSPLGAQLERLGIAIGALSHVLISRGGADVRSGHGRAFRRALARQSA